MSNDSPFNLFKQQPKKKPSPAKPLATPSPKIPIDKSQQAEKTPSSSSSADFKDVIEKVTKLHDELQQKIDETYQKAGWSLGEIKLFLENPNNFDENEWERVQRERKHLANQMWSFVGEDAKERITVEEKKKESKGSRSKLLGSRKKNWIPVK